MGGDHHGAADKAIAAGSNPFSLVSTPVGQPPLNAATATRKDGMRIPGMPVLAPAPAAESGAGSRRESPADQLGTAMPSQGHNGASGSGSMPVAQILKAGFTKCKKHKNCPKQDRHLGRCKTVHGHEGTRQPALSTGVPGIEADAPPDSMLYYQPAAPKMATDKPRAKPMRSCNCRQRACSTCTLCSRCACTCQGTASAPLGAVEIQRPHPTPSVARAADAPAKPRATAATPKRSCGCHQRVCRVCKQCSRCSCTCQANSAAPAKTARQPAVVAHRPTQVVAVTSPVRSAHHAPAATSKPRAAPKNSLKTCACHRRICSTCKQCTRCACMCFTEEMAIAAGLSPATKPMPAAARQAGPACNTANVAHAMAKATRPTKRSCGCKQRACSVCNLCSRCSCACPGGPTLPPKLTRVSTKTAAAHTATPTGGSKIKIKKHHATATERFVHAGYPTAKPHTATKRACGCKQRACETCHLCVRCACMCYGAPLAKPRIGRPKLAKFGVPKPKPKFKTSKVPRIIKGQVHVFTFPACPPLHCNHDDNALCVACVY